MREFLTALALVLVLEGVALAIFSDRLGRVAERLSEVPPPVLRLAGLGSASLGVFFVWLIRG